RSNLLYIGVAPSNTNAGRPLSSTRTSPVSTVLSVAADHVTTESPTLNRGTVTGFAYLTDARSMTAVSTIRLSTGTAIGAGTTAGVTAGSTVARASAHVPTAVATRTATVPNALSELTRSNLTAVR